MGTRCRKKLNTETFAPGRQADEELRLARSHPDVVIDTLSSILTQSRCEAVERVVANRTGRLQVAVEGVYDPHNTAAVIRSADAFGIQQVHVIEGEHRFRSSRSVTQGAHKWVDVTVHRDTGAFVSTMRQSGIRIVVAAMDGAVDVRRLARDEPLVLVFGNESEGISPEMFAAADGVFRIPMYGFVESLNVSVAASVAMAALREGGGGDLSDVEKSVLKARYYLRSVRAGVAIVRRTLSPAKMVSDDG